MSCARFVQFGGFGNFMRLFGLWTALFGWALLFAPWSFAQTDKSFSE